MTFVICFSLARTNVYSAAVTKDSIEHYFAGIKNDFDKLADNPAMKKAQGKSVNGIFVSSLKKHQPVYSYMRTNAKGVMINEVVRGQVPEKVKKNVRKQDWFKRISKTATEYYGFTFIEENGRYYLFWVTPILGHKNKFEGAVVAKIDLWDCFHEISKETTEPFLIKLGGKSLYSDKWKNGSAILETPLSVPGVEKISLIVEKQEPALDTAAKKDTGAVAAVSPALLGDQKVKKEMGFFAKNKVLIIIIGIIALGVIIFLLIQFYMWLSNVFTMRAINKADDDPFGRR